jgi:hypothetical protein
MGVLLTARAGFGRFHPSFPWPRQPARPGTRPRSRCRRPSRVRSRASGSGGSWQDLTIHPLAARSLARGLLTRAVDRALATRRRYEHLDMCDLQDQLQSVAQRECD